MTSPATEVARLFLQADDDEPADAEGGLRVITLRVTEGRLAYLDAMAAAAEVSRNVMANELLRVGISEVLGELPDTVREDVQAGVVDRMGGV